jgi:hypothetical protein
VCGLKLYPNQPRRNDDDAEKSWLNRTETEESARFLCFFCLFFPIFFFIPVIGFFQHGFSPPAISGECA